MTSSKANLDTKIKLHLAEWRNRRRLKAISEEIAKHLHPNPGEQPVVFFNASSRITGLSQNASFTLLSAWSLQLKGIPVVHFVCKRGMKHCMLGTNRSDYTLPPPCQTCVSQSQRLYPLGNVEWFTYQEDAELVRSLAQLDLASLCDFSYPIKLSKNAASTVDIPLGNIVLPSLRWALRRHHLPDDENTRGLLRDYISSAYSIAQRFVALLHKLSPRAVVIFNGSTYPEAIVRWVSMKSGVRTLTHEVGFQPLSVFFTDQQATAYPIEIPADFELSPAQNKRLDTYLEHRFQGNFTMAGIRFWPEMRPLSQDILAKASHFEQIVPIFTNVVYDTSQIHANVVFSNMFEWLDSLLPLIKSYTNTLFVIRAHPDEMRVGTAKLANESVQDWIRSNKVEQFPNVVFIDPTEYISSYELIRRSKFVIVYNSSIGLEATLLGKAVICGGRARYTKYPIVYYFETQEQFLNEVKSFLEKDEIHLPPAFQNNARRFLYFQLYRTSLPMGEFIETIPRRGFVQLKSFPWENLLPENSTTMKVIYRGIIDRQPFLYPEEL